MAPKVLQNLVLVVPFSRSLPGIDFLMHFGRPLAPFDSLLARLWFLLAPVWFPLAPFWLFFGSLRLPFGDLWLNCGALWLLFSTLWVQFWNFLSRFSIFPYDFHISLHFSRFYEQFNWKRSDFWIWHPSHSRFLPLPCFFTSNFEENPHTTDSTPVENKFIFCVTKMLVHFLLQCWLQHSKNTFLSAFHLNNGQGKPSLWHFGHSDAYSIAKSSENKGFTKT